MPQNDGGQVSLASTMAMLGMSNVGFWRFFTFKCDRRNKNRQDVYAILAIAYHNARGIPDFRPWVYTSVGLSQKRVQALWTKTRPIQYSMESASEYKIYIESPIFGHQKKDLCFFLLKTLVMILAQQNRIPYKINHPPPPKKGKHQQCFFFLSFFSRAQVRTLYLYVLFFCGQKNSTPVGFTLSRPGNLPDCTAWGWTWKRIYGAVGSSWMCFFPIKGIRQLHSPKTTPTNKKGLTRG